VSSTFTLHCRVCEDVAPPEPIAACRRCDGPTDVAYDWSRVGTELSRAAVESGPLSMWRYHALLPVRGAVTDGPGWTPLVHADRLSEALGVDLYLKLETTNPTHSVKDRVAAVTRAVAVDYGIGTLCCSSRGDLGDAIAAEAAAGGLETIILTPAGASPAGAIARACGARVIVIDGSYDDCRRIELELAQLFPWGFLASTLHPYAVEGLKTIAYEVVEQLGWELPDAIVAPAAQGSLLAKSAQAFNELARSGLTRGTARIVGGQPRGCDPIAAAFDDNRAMSRVVPATDVDELAVGDPAYGELAIGAARASGGTIVSVPEDEVAVNVELLARTTGIVADAAGGVAVGALVEAIRTRTIEEGSRVVLVVTGSGVKPEVPESPASAEPVAADVSLVLEQLGVRS
jgi:threonine synthase